MKGYLIAFSGKPKSTFLSALRDLSSKDGVEIRGAILTDGPGCRNLAILVDDDVPEVYAERLTMALMPAKFCDCSDPRLVAGEFINELSE